MKRISKLKGLVLTSMFAALCCVATMVVQIPTPTGGFLHLGDAMVLLCGWMLGPVWGALAAGIGSMLADVFSGYVLYAPATLLIKGAVAVLGWLLHAIFLRLLRNRSLIALIISGILAEVVMVLGYFVYEATVCSYGWGAVAGVPGNCIQAAFGIIVGAVLMNLMERMHIRERFLFGSQTKC